MSVIWTKVIKPLRLTVIFSLQNLISCCTSGESQKKTLCSWTIFSFSDNYLVTTPINLATPLRVSCRIHMKLKTNIWDVIWRKAKLLSILWCLYNKWKTCCSRRHLRPCTLEYPTSLQRQHQQERSWEHWNYTNWFKLNSFNCHTLLLLSGSIVCLYFGQNMLKHACMYVSIFTSVHLLYLAICPSVMSVFAKSALKSSVLSFSLLTVREDAVVKVCYHV